MFRLTLGFLFLGALSLACNSGSGVQSPDPLQVRQIPSEYQESLDPLVYGNSTFAFDLYKKLKGEPGNLLICPFSVSTALAMTWGGARGITEMEMAQTLHFPLAQDQLHPVFGALLTSLDIGSNLGGYSLEMANRLWGQTGFDWAAPFIDLTEDHYHAPMTDLDFAAEPEPSRRQINLWVSERTQRKIPELLPKDSITPVTMLVLTNAIYFKGDWETSFSPDRTTRGSFIRADGQIVVADYMKQSGPFLFADLDGFQILEIPYTGGDLAMYVILPDAVDGVTDLEERIGPESLDMWIAEMKIRDIEILLPKFAFRSKFRLKDPLIDLGMTTAFGGEANLTGLHPQGGLWISEVYHEAYIKIDEEGTEAAGATGVVIDRHVFPEGLYANHPFLFLIRDQVTGSLLFLGRVSDPSEV